MITQEEKDEIINAAVEKTLLVIPEVIGNLMASHASLHKINTKFYADYPEYKDKKDVVASVVEMIEGRTPLAKYEDILRDAIPKIRERINTMKNLDMNNVDQKPNRDFSDLGIGEFDKSKQHGEI